MPRNHIIEVEHSACGYTKTRAAYQYDYGQILELQGFPELPATFEMFFSIGLGQAITRIGTGGAVAVPDVCLERYGTVTAWLFLHDAETDGETRYAIEIPVRSRGKVTDQEPTPEERGLITEAIAALNAGVAAAEAAQEGAEAAQEAAEEAGSTLSGAVETLAALQPAATPEDVGKYLKAKTVENGKVTEYEFGSGGGGGGGGSDVVPVFRIDRWHNTFTCDMAWSDVLEAADAGTCDRCQLVTIAFESSVTTLHIYNHDVENGEIGFCRIFYIGDQLYCEWIEYRSGGEIIHDVDAVDFTDLLGIPQHEDIQDFPIPKGTLCWKEGRIYKAREEIEDGIWNDRDWEETSIIQEIESAKAPDDTKADKTDTVLTSTLSRGRQANSTVGGGSFAFGSGVTASGDYAHAEGGGTTASGDYAHAEGAGTTASGYSAHAEGGGTTASGYCAHAEGGGTTASGDHAHAEGASTKATGRDAHAEGGSTTASGECAHAEGAATEASGYLSHAEGEHTIASKAWQHVSGRYNSPEGTSGPSVYAEIIGNGTAENARSNARTLDWDGNERIAGDLYVHANPNGTGGIRAATIDEISMLIAPTAVSGTTPSITAEPGKRYVCGECTTVGITAPENGIVEVVFDCGATPASLTVTPPAGKSMRWADGFNPASLDANATYCIRIMDGRLGSATKWA